MRSFATACFAAFIIAAAAAAILGLVQKPASAAFSTSAVRL
jgi:hypothetical protein